VGWEWPVRMGNQQYRVSTATCKNQQAENSTQIFTTESNMQNFPTQIAERLKVAAATPVIDGDGMPRRIAIDRAIAWCKSTYPNHFHGDDYAPPKTTRVALRRGASKGKTHGPGD
jgi:hypothetical protein